VRKALPVLAGVALGGALLGAVVSCGEAPFREVEEVRPRADEADIRTWEAEWDRRAKPLQAVPDPPGEGPVASRRYWISHDSYAMEVRRRGDRLVVEIHGIDRQTGGGGWTAFGEGRVAGDVATITWSCVSSRFRTAGDGVARLTFRDGGRAVEAVYAPDDSPDLWMKTYGVEQRPGEAAPERGTLRGQIPIAPVLAHLAADEAVRLPVVVLDEGGAPVADALVQVKGLDRTRTQTDKMGRATIEFRGRDAPVAQVVCAGAPGYRNGAGITFADDLRRRPSDSPLEIRVTRIDLADHPNYAWRNPAPDADPDDAMACGTCHKWEYDEWSRSRHARSADAGHVEWEHARMTKADPEAPDDCRGCHQPADAVDRPGGGWARRGSMAAVHCDFCHKVRYVDDLRKSGVFGALVLARPDPLASDRPGDIHRVFGTSPDVTFAYMGASYDPFLGASFFCAGCHEGGGRTDLGRPKIDTFDEWRSWVALRQDDRFRSCQDCHMPGASTKTVDGTPVDQFAWDALRRRPGAVHSHRFEGTGAAFAAEALDVGVTKRFDGAAGEWVVDVSLRNVGAGHKIPTGTWSKHVAVGVWARVGERWLRQTGGDRARLLPGGEPPAEGLAEGDWRNPAGTVLGVLPKDPAYAVPAAFWGAWSADAIKDDRLPAGAERLLHCRFAGTEKEVPEVFVQVVHRRGEIGAGPASAPWEVRPYDPPPQTLWRRIVR
jgi:hypothetical protein